jgi:hypothetical protein
VRRTRAIQFVSLDHQGKQYDPTRSLIVGIPVPDVLGRDRCARAVLGAKPAWLSIVRYFRNAESASC